MNTAVRVARTGQVTDALTREHLRCSVVARKTDCNAGTLNRNVDGAAAINDVGTLQTRVEKSHEQTDYRSGSGRDLAHFATEFTKNFRAARPDLSKSGQSGSAIAQRPSTGHLRVTAFVAAL